MASHVVNLHWLNPDNKEDQRVRLTTEGRSSKSVDCVIEQVDRAIWSMHGDSNTISEQLDLSKVRAKLTERHSNVLSLVEQHWMLTDRALNLVRLLNKWLRSWGTTHVRRRYRRLMRWPTKGWWRSSPAQTTNAERWFPFNR